MKEKNRTAVKKLRLGILLGGPSPERGISLNSARSVIDHLDGDDIEIVPIYFDFLKRPYLISRAQLYSNTPSDFDFKLAQFSKPLSSRALIKLLRSLHIAFPAMHGPFGEDGGIQGILENAGVPYIGASKEACRGCFDKYLANQALIENGFFALPSIVIEGGASASSRAIRAAVSKFFKQNKISKAIVKPAIGGSSIGVFAVHTVDEAAERVQHLLNSGFYHRVVVEECCEGTEFTLVILQNRFGLPVSLIPIEIEADYSQRQIFDYRKKYLPTRQVTYHCPPRFEDRMLEKIMAQGESLFALFKINDFARFDGWVRPDGNIWFSDFNPISGMEQNSFLFLQAARVGFSHRDVLRYIVWHACKRHNIDWKSPAPQRHDGKGRIQIPVLFGGDTAERQVSLMSGTNVWLKLRRSRKYSPTPYLLDPDGSVWELPYEFTLNHTVEEISESVRKAVAEEPRVAVLRRRVLNRLQPHEEGISEDLHLPRQMTLDSLLKDRKFVFLALHGGKGEDGTIQRMCEERGIRFNGPGSEASALCMNKHLTAEAVQAAAIPGVSVPKKRVLQLSELRTLDRKAVESLWADLHSGLPGESFIVKPIGDGCSAGIARLNSAEDFARYLSALTGGSQRIPPLTLSGQNTPIELPTRQPQQLLIEEFIHTDRVLAQNNKLLWQHVSGWIEITVGVLGRLGAMHALNPSLTVASGDVLSVEEKFQGGTGINITPPPAPFVPKKIVEIAKKRTEMIAAVLGLKGYSRLDLFLHIKNGDLKLIEANSLPALTPSTVLFHQALAEKPPIYPISLIERIVELGEQGD